MFTLEISSIGSACNKNPYEPKNKAILIQLCKEQGNRYRDLFFKNEVFTRTDTVSKDEKFKTIYKKFKGDAMSTKDFKEIEEKVVKEFKKCEPDADTTCLVKSLKEDLKKDCGKNNEELIIKKNNYTKGNNRMWTYKSEMGWELKGLHDASDGEVVIEVKTRMKINNVRKNTYDLYQLFGYLLVMKKTKGKIVQMYNNQIFDSEIETDIEYGTIDLEQEKWLLQFEKFKKELNAFFQEVEFYSDKIFDIWSVFNRFNLPIAQFDKRGVCFNIVPGFEKLTKLLI